MLIKDVERFTIPLASRESFREDDGTSVEELIKALKKLPKKAVVTTDFNGHNIFVTHHKPDIESECPYENAMEQTIKQMAAASYIPAQFLRP